MGTDLCKMFGGNLGSISDKLFDVKKVKYISLFHTVNDPFTNRPETEGEIKFDDGPITGKRKFKGDSIVDVLQQMQEFLKSL